MQTGVAVSTNTGVCRKTGRAPTNPLSWLPSLDDSFSPFLSCSPPPPQDENGKKPAKATEPANAFYQEHDTSEDDAEEGEGDAQENDDQDSSEGDEPGVARPLPATRRPLRAPMPKVCCPDKAAPLHPRHWRTAHTAAHPL